VLFENLCVDFESARDALATSEFAERTSASFLFARQAMLLVELATTVARQDRATYQRFALELQKREPLLFKRIPYKPGRGTRGCVPRLARDGDSTSELIEVLFDLVRNGHAHFGHQLYAPLKDGGAFGVVLLGVEKERTRSAGVDRRRATRPTRPRPIRCQGRRERAGDPSRHARTEPRP
jgi:hypothetical protein